MRIKGLSLRVEELLASKARWTDEKWIFCCKSVVHDYHRACIDKAFEPPSFEKWKHAAELKPETESPIFGWIQVAKNSNIPSHDLRALLDILVRGGFEDAMTKRNKDGENVFDLALAHAPRAFGWLRTLDCVYISNTARTVSLCVKAGLNEDAFGLFMDMDVTERIISVSNFDWFVCAGMRRDGYEKFVLACLPYLRDIPFGNAIKGMCYTGSMSINSTTDSPEYHITLLNVFAGCKSSEMWRIATTSQHEVFVRYRELEFSGEFDGRDYYSPLAAALQVDDDYRAAWLAERVTTAELNKYDMAGYTPAMQASSRGMPLTLQVLLKRVDEIDLCAERLLRESGVNVAADAFHAGNGAKFIVGPGAVGVMVQGLAQTEVGKALQAATAKQIARKPHVAKLVAATLDPYLADDLIEMCLDYAELPLSFGIVEPDAKRRKLSKR